MPINVHSSFGFNKGGLNPKLEFHIIEEIRNTVADICY